MKPNANENPSAKSSLSKSMKKSTKSRSKNSKSTTNNASQSQKAATPKVNPQEPTASTSASISATTSEDSKELKGEKVNGNSRMSAFTAKSIKNFWEQYNTHEVDVMPEVFTRLAEDATYKVCELVQNIKTYARHSGGKVTFDLVNQVLKDSDVQPILGAGEMDFEKIEHEGTSYYFDNDNILELRDEYLKEFETRTPIKSEISASWVLDKKHSKLLMDFAFCLNKAIILGDNDAYKFGLDAAAFAPQIGCCLGLLLRKCIEMLAFDQKFGIVERCLKYLQALSINVFARDALVRQHLFHLSEIIVCLLLGTLKSIQPSIKKEPKLEKKEASFEIVKNYLENSDTDIKKEVVALNPVDVDDIRQEYEALFQMMERDGFQERPDNFEEVGNVEYIRPTVDICDGIKVEPDVELDSIQQHQQQISGDQGQSQITVNQMPQQQIKVEQIGMDQSQQQIGIDQNSQQIGMDQSTQQQIRMDQTQQQINNDLLQPQPISIDQMSQETLSYQILDEPFTIVSEEQIIPEQTTDEMIAEAISLQFSPYQAKMVDFQNVEIVCDTLGNLGSQYGYFQTECIYLIQKRIEKFFTIKEVFSENDYQYISRCFRGLIALGEAGIREILPFLENINPDLIDECYHNDFSLSAVFLRGPADEYFYEWLIDLCGDKLQPFMVYLYNFHERLLKERLHQQRSPGYKIYSKVQLKSIEKLPVNNQTNENMNLQFPERTIMKIHKRIGFKFSGCRPVLLKSKIQPQKVVQKPLQAYNAKIRIGKRKLFKPLTDIPSTGNCYNYCYTQI